MSTSWEAIEALADSIVQKASGDMTREKAIDVALQTPEGRRLYAKYVAGDDPVATRTGADVAREAERRQELLAGRAHLAGSGYRFTKSEPELSNGRAADAIWEEITKSADVLIEKHDGALTREQAVDRVLKSASGRRLYSEYSDALQWAGLRSGWHVPNDTSSPASVRKNESTVLSKAAQDFLDDFTQWLSEGGRSSFSKADDVDPLEQWLDGV